MQISVAFALPKWADIAIVLGGGITKKGKLPHDVKVRLRKALYLWKKGFFSTFLLSGGRTRRSIQVSEASLMKLWLLENQVPPSQILIEEKALDVLGSAIYTRPMVKDFHILLITSDYHLPRSLDLFTHVYGPKYAIYGVASHPFIAHRLILQLREWQLREITDYLLRNTEPGDLNSAKKLLGEVEEFLKSNKLI